MLSAHCNAFRRFQSSFVRIVASRTKTSANTNTWGFSTQWQGAGSNEKLTGHVDFAGVACSWVSRRKVPFSYGFVQPVDWYPAINLTRKLDRTTLRIPVDLFWKCSTVIRPCILRMIGSHVYCTSPTILLAKNKMDWALTDSLIRIQNYPDTTDSLAFGLQCLSEIKSDFTHGAATQD